MRTLRHSLLAAAVLSTLMPAAVPAADTAKGRWINDGFGRATRDGHGSTCVSSGGDTHAFARQDCDEAAVQRRSGAQGTAGDDVVDLVKSEPPATKSEVAEPARAKEPEPAPTAADAAGPTDSSGAAPADAGTGGDGAAAAASVEAGADGGIDAGAGTAAAAGAAAAGAASLAGSDDDAKADSTEAAGDGGASDATATDAGATTEAGSPAEVDPDYAPGSVVLEDRSPGIAPPTSATPEHKPVIDNRVPEFPVTKYTAEGAKAAVEAPPAAPPAKKDAGPMQGDTGPQILKRTLQLEKSSLFNSNSAALRTDFVPVLDEVVAALKGAKSIHMVTVTGHTDRSGSPAHNQRLSEQRAKAVRGYLVVRGIDPGKIVAVGKGPTEPVTKPADCAGLKGVALRKCYAPDRRVEITATGTKEDVVIKK